MSGSNKGHRIPAQSIEQNEEQFRIMADGIPQMIWVTDPSGRVQFVNRAYTEFFGVLLEDVQSGGWQPPLHPEDGASYVREYMACLGDRRPFHAEARVRQHDGQWRWVESFGRPRVSPSGEFLGIAGSSPDITDRKRAEETLRNANEDLLAQAGQLQTANELLQSKQTELEEANEQLREQEQDLVRHAKALRESEQRYRTLVETAPDGLVVHRDGRFLFANGAAVSLVGAESLGQLACHTVLDFFRSEQREQASERMCTAMAGNRLPGREAIVDKIDEMLFNIVKHAGVHEAAMRVRRFEGYVCWTGDAGSTRES